ncbi:hypothetical protein Droror1_Dr00002501 [Drosera rotundifolia]
MKQHIINTIPTTPKPEGRGEEIELLFIRSNICITFHQIKHFCEEKTNRFGGRGRERRLVAGLLAGQGRETKRGREEGRRKRGRERVNGGDGETAVKQFENGEMETAVNGERNEAGKWEIGEE